MMSVRRILVVCLCSFGSHGSAEERGIRVEAHSSQKAPTGLTKSVSISETLE